MDREEDVFIYNGVDEVPEDVTHVRVDQSVTFIQQQAFNNRQKMVEVELPEGLIRIENNAFKQCHSLKRINIPSTVEEIGDYSFDRCKKLDGIILPQGLQILGERAFNRCRSLKTINIPPGIESIKRGMFFGCNRLIDITFSEGLQEIGRDAFTICDALPSVTFPSSLKVIGEMAFEFCDHLNNIQIHDNVETIVEGAFNGCKLVSFRMPPLVKKFNVGVMAENNSMVSIELSENVTKVLADDNIRVMKANSLRNIALPPQCTIVDKDLWCKCKDLKVAFPDTNDEDNDDTTITDSLLHRFDDLPIHKICYYQSYNNMALDQLNISTEIKISQRRSKTNPTGKEQDCLGMTPLHILACSTKPTIEMYRILIEKYPETLIMKDKWGDIPLFYAIWCNAPAEVIDLLVESYTKLHPDYEFDWSGMIQTLSKRYARLLIIQKLISTLQNSFPHQECDLQQVVTELASLVVFNNQITDIETFRYLLRASITERLDSLAVGKWRVELENDIHGIREVIGRKEDTRAIYHRLDTYESIKEGTSIQ